MLLGTIAAITLGKWINRKRSNSNSNLNSIEVLISKAFIDSNIGHDESVLTNNVLNEYDDMKKEIQNLKT